MITRAEYALAHDKWHTTPATLTEYDFSALAEFGSTSRTLGSEVARARAAHVKAITTTPAVATAPAAPPHTSQRSRMRPEVLAQSVAQAIAATVGPLQQRVKARETDAAAAGQRIAALEAMVNTLADRLLELEAARAVEQQARG